MRLLALLTASLCLAQDPQTYKASVRLVNVAFSVRDARGNLVNDLTRDDFEIFDDGAEQKIAFFARNEELPLSLGLIADFSGSQQHFIKQHQKDIREFLKRVLRPNDQAFLVLFGNRLRLASDFSSDAHNISERLDPKDSTYPELGPRETRILGTAFYDSLYYSTTVMLAGAANARRALVVFSDGEDNSSAHHMLDAIEAAQGENVVVFGVRYTEVKRGLWTGRNKYGVSVMDRISHDTGGMVFDAEKTDMKAAFRSIDQELRSLYELAYHSSNVADNTFHKIVVRVKRPGLTVRTKSGYYAKE